MAGAAQRDIIVIDDEDPAPPAEVVALQEKVASLETQLAGARARAENAFTAKTEVTRENKELRKQLEVENRKDRLVAKSRAELELSGKIESLRAELDDAERRADDSRRRESDLDADLEDARRKADDLTRENEALRKELADSKTNPDLILAQQLEEERVKYLARTNELTRQHAQSSQRGGGSSQLPPKEPQYAQSIRHSMESNPLPEKMARVDDRVQRQPQHSLMQQQQRKRHSMEAGSLPEKFPRLNDHEDRQQQPYGSRQSQQLQQHRSPPRMQQQQHQSGLQRQQPSPMLLRLRQDSPPRVQQQRTQSGLQPQPVQQPPSQMQQQSAAAAPQPPRPAPIVTPSAPAPIKPAGTVASDPAHNLFKLCDSDSADAVDIDKAIGWMRKSVDELGREDIKRRPDELVRCELCKWNYKGVGVVDHFLTPRHADLVRGKGAAVSMTALAHWLEQLKPMDAADDAAGTSQ